MITCHNDHMSHSSSSSVALAFAALPLSFNFFQFHGLFASSPPQQRWTLLCGTQVSVCLPWVAGEGCWQPGYSAPSLKIYYLCCGQGNMQSQDSSTTGDDSNAPDQLVDIEAGEDVWKSVSNSQSAAEADAHTVSAKEVIAKPAEAFIRSPQSSQNRQIPVIKESPPQSLPKSQPAPPSSKPSSPHTSKRSDSQIISKLAAPPLIDQSQPASPAKQVRALSSPLKFPSPQKMATKGAESQSVWSVDSIRGGDTLQLDSTVPGTIGNFEESAPDLESYANFAL